MQGENRPGIVQSKSEINAVFGPERLQLRLPFDGIGPHAEARLKQIQGVLVGGTALGGGVARLLAHRIPQFQWGLSVLDL